MLATGVALAAMLLLMLLGDLAASPRIAAAGIAAGFLGLLLLGDSSLTVRWILTVAVILRLGALTLAPTLSDDLWRYLWEGRVAVAGENPWRHAPDDPALAALRDPLWQRVGHREVASVYPPLSMAAFSIAALSPRPVLAWRTLVGVADLAVCWGLLLWLARRGLPTSRAVWYAWNPLPILEGPGMGHLDALAIGLVVAGVLALESRPARPRLAAVLTALGGLTKLAPLSLIPSWARASGRPLGFLSVAAVVTLVGALPMVIAGAPSGLQQYAIRWEFAGPLFEPLARTFAALGVDESIKSAFDGVERATGRWDLLDRWYPLVYPELLAKLLLGAAALGAVVVSVGVRDPLVAAGRLFGALLLCSATVHPWYLLWVLPFAAVCRRRAWRLASATAFLSYAAPLGLLAAWPWAWAAQWLPVAAVWALEARAARNVWRATD